MPGYELLNGFQHVYLEDSFVTRLFVRIGAVEVEVETVLTEAHPKFSPPLAGERYCYAFCRITFDKVDSVVWTMPTVKPAISADGSIDYGGFDRFDIVDGTFLVEGDFGRLAIAGGSVRIAVESRCKT